MVNFQFFCRSLKCSVLVSFFIPSDAMDRLNNPPKPRSPSSPRHLNGEKSLYSTFLAVLVSKTMIVKSWGWRGGEEKRKKTTFRPLGFLRSEEAQWPKRLLSLLFPSPSPSTLCYQYTLFQTKVSKTLEWPRWYPSRKTYNKTSISRNRPKIVNHKVSGLENTNTAILSLRWCGNQDRAEALLRVLIKQIAAWICCIARRDWRLDC